MARYPQRTRALAQLRCCAFGHKRCTGTSYAPSRSICFPRPALSRYRPRGRFPSKASSLFAGLGRRPTWSFVSTRTTVRPVSCPPRRVRRARPFCVIGRFPRFRRNRRFLLWPIAFPVIFHSQNVEQARETWVFLKRGRVFLAEKPQFSLYFSLLSPATFYRDPASTTNFFWVHSGHMGNSLYRTHR